MNPESDQLRVLAFDVFGTVVDWYTSVRREIEQIAPAIDGNRFALAWREAYVPAMRRVMSGQTGWTTIDVLHRQILEDLLPQFGLTQMSNHQRNHLNQVWHRLDAWPDSIAGLVRLKSRFTICTLSNGNMSLLTNMAKHAGLPWDCILSAEIFRRYKPDPATYLGVANLLDVRPDQVMLVAAHQSDLAAARACGLQTAYIERPAEYGPAVDKDISANPANTYHARDLAHLADLLGA